MIRPHADLGRGPYQLRNPNELFTSKWIVTARFTVQTGPGETISCVRVRHGVGPVMHFTADEFERLFAPAQPDSREP